MGESVEMRADYLAPWLDLLGARLEPGERILAQGRAFEPHGDSFELSEVISGPGCAVVVTQRRALWVGRSDRRWVRALPFAVVRFYVELAQAHRAGVPAGQPRSLPKRDRGREVPNGFLRAR